MTNYIAQPDGYDIKVGHNLYEVELGNYFKVMAKKNFQIGKSQALTSGQKVNSIQLTELKSSESEVYWVESIILMNKIKLWMQYRDKVLFSTNTTEYLDFDKSNLISPFNFNQWMYNYTPTMDIEEDAALAITSDTRFNGITFTLKKYDTRNDNDAAVINKIIEGKERCWSIRG